jgi:hypothetical protein
MKTITLNLTEEEIETLIKLVTFIYRDIEDDLGGEPDHSLSHSSAYFLSNAFRLVNGLVKKLTVAAEEATGGKLK